MSHVRARVGTMVVTVAMLVGAVGLASPAAAATIGSPRGNLERVAGVVGAIELAGWAFDPDTASSIFVWVTVDGVGRHVYANKGRADVAAAFPGQGAEHGFASSIPASGGTHTVCATASNVGAGAHTPLGCRAVSVAGAATSWGNLDAVTPAEGGIQVAGWAIDGDTTAPVYVWMTVDGVGRHLYASLARPDVAAVYPAYGGNHGFSGRLTAGAGSHRVCATISNVGAGSHTPLGCRSVTVAAVEQVLGVSASSPTAPAAPTSTATTPAPGARPNADNTGVPVGTRLRVHNGNVTITTAGTVIDGLDVTGVVVVRASNVTIRNTRIRGQSSNTYTTPLIKMMDGYSNLVVQDSELVPEARSPYLYGIIGWNFTLERVEIARVVDGVHIIGSNVTVRSSYIHDLNHYTNDPNRGGGETHDDGIQVQIGTNLRVENNTILGGWNAAIQVTQDRGHVGDFQVTRNYMDGGMCTVNIAEKAYGPLAGVVVTDNTFGRTTRIYDCAVINPITTTLTTRSNFFADGTPIRVRKG